MAVAHRMYARALFDAARDQGRLDGVAEEFGDFVESVRTVPELRALLENPEVDRHVKVAALRELLGGADELVRNFVLVLAEKGRTSEIEEIFDEFQTLLAAAEGRLEVELTTAVELSDAEAAEILAQIEAASGRPVTATRHVDPEIIGGIVLQAGSQRVDASVRGRLERLRRQLTTATA